MRRAHTGTLTFLTVLGMHDAVAKVQDAITIQALRKNDLKARGHILCLVAR